MTKKVVLVTGGAGFVGSHLCKALLKRGNRVICMDNFFTGRMSNIQPLKENPDLLQQIETLVREKLNPQAQQQQTSQAQQQENTEEEQQQ